MRLVGHPMIGLFGHCVDQLEVSRLLAAIAKVAFSCIHAWEKTNTRDGYKFKYAWPILNAVSVFRRFSTRRIGIFPFVFFFLFVCLFVSFLRYCGFWYTPMSPSSTGSFTRGYNYRALTGKIFCVLDIYRTLPVDKCIFSSPIIYTWTSIKRPPMGVSSSSRLMKVGSSLEIN